MHNLKMDQVREDLKTLVLLCGIEKLQGIGYGQINRVVEHTSIFACFSALNS